MAEPHLNGGGISNIPPHSDQLQLTPSQNDEDDILKYLLADSSSDLSSPDGSPMLVLDNDTGSDASPWRSDDVFSTVPSGLPDIGFEFDTNPETLLYGSNFSSMDYNSFPMEIKSAPLSPPPVVPVAPVASPPQPTSPTPTQAPQATPIQPIIQPKKVSRTKKRPRVSEPPPIPSPEKAEVALPRDTLLNISSQGMERYVENLTSARALTMDDQKELKRQKRLIKNRESAQLSRERKRAYIDQLEDRINQLVNENTGLKNENTALRQALAQYEALSGSVVPKVEIPSSDTAAYRKSQAATSTGDSSLARHATKMAGLLTSATTIGSRPSSAAAKAGVCLMIVLFTFGLFMNSTMNPVVPRGLLPASASLKGSDGISDIVPYVSRERTGYKRSILEAFPEVMDEDDDGFFADNSKQLATKEVESLIIPANNKKEMQVQRQIIESPIVKPAGIYKVSYSPEPAKFWVSSDPVQQEHDSNNSTYMLFLDPRPDLEANESDAGVATPPSTPSSPTSSSDLQVSTHTHVKNVIHPGNGLPPMIISLVVPNHIANGSNPLFPKEGYHADSLMEITCQVVDISITTSEKPHTAN